jgi:hypothetical protein
MNDKKAHMIAKHGGKAQTENVELQKEDNTVILEAVGMEMSKNDEMINLTNTEETTPGDKKLNNSSLGSI